MKSDPAPVVGECPRCARRANLYPAAPRPFEGVRFLVLCMRCCLEQAAEMMGEILSVFREAIGGESA